MPTTTSFPAEIFAALTPAPYLLKHLTAPSANQYHGSPIRANGRTTNQFRPPVINTDSLTHGSGSAVVRTGDTAVVCGVRGEILMAKDVPNSHAAKARAARRSGASASSAIAAGADATDGSDGQELISQLNLLVPNVELATGCSPAFLPGQAPSTLAQSLAHRLLALLRTTRVLALEDLEITYTPPKADAPSSASSSDSDSDDSMNDGEDDGETEEQVIAYWTLYIDLTLISLDGNPFDACWAALLAALQNTTLPRAWYDADIEAVLCSDARSEATTLRVRGRPFTATFGVFESDEGDQSGKSGKQGWILADPDEFEEGLCAEEITAVVDCSGGGGGDDDEEEEDAMKVLRIEKSGGGVVARKEMRDVLSLAGARWMEWNAVVMGAE